MTREQMIENVKKMCKYADDKLYDVVQEKLYIEIDYDAYHYKCFEFIPGCKSCFRWGTHGGTFDALYADKTAENSGSMAGTVYFSYEDTPTYVIREDLMRCAMLSWPSIKEKIERALAKQRELDNFTL